MQEKDECQIKEINTTTEWNFYSTVEHGYCKLIFLLSHIFNSFIKNLEYITNKNSDSRARVL